MRPFRLIYLGLFLLFAVTGWAAVTISSPANGTTLTSPVQVNASISGSRPATIFVYANNALVFQQQSAAFSVNTALSLNAGKYTITVVAQYNRRWSTSATANITVSGTPSSTPPGSSGSVAAQISGDMQGTNEGHPHGVPSDWDWANGPVVEMGNNSTGWKAIEAWGLVYEAAEGNPAVNTRVNIRNVQLFFLQKSTGKWLLLQNTSSPAGAAYVEDFSNDSNIPTDIRREPDGSISVMPGNGYCFHFYPVDRASIDPNDIGGIVVVYDARLLVDNSALPDDRSSARFVADAGADYYPALSGGCPIGDNGGCPGVAIGKMKYVKTGWRSFAMTTMTSAQLAGNPPPVNLSGILP